MLEVKKSKDRFYIGDSEEDAVAEILFTVTDDDIIRIDSTEVSKSLDGQGVGKILLKEVVDLARAEKKKIIPICPYAKYQMEKNEEYRDMLK